MTRARRLSEFVRGNSKVTVYSEHESLAQCYYYSRQESFFGSTKVSQSVAALSAHVVVSQRQVLRQMLRKKRNLRASIQPLWQYTASFVRPLELKNVTKYLLFLMYTVTFKTHVRKTFYCELFAILLKYVSV